MNLLVAGASGFVGRGLLPLLASSGIGGLASGRKPPAFVPQGLYSVCRGDVLSSGTQSLPIDGVVHLEVRQHVPCPGASDVADFERVNVGNTLEWLDWAQRTKVCRFVLLSSIKAVASSDLPQDETAPPDATSPYGRSKALSEQAVRD